jgi:CubicO group peptidase (beta-lactamase class C family)
MDPTGLVTDAAVNARVTDLIHRQVEAGHQLGVQVCAYQHGAVVVDTWAGRMGPDDARPVREDSLFLSMATTKSVAALAAHILIDRGLIALDAPVARYWPAFAAHGKGAITVAQALSHQSGLYRMASPARLEDFTDWDRGLRRLEDATPAYPPGKSTGYEAVTWAWLIGGLVEAASGRHIRDLIAADIAAPLGVADEMYVGIPPGVEDRLATVDILRLGVDTPVRDGAKLLDAVPLEIWDHINSMPFRTACLPSANGHFTARALARMYAALANGGAIDGVRLVSPEAVAQMQTEQTRALDVVNGRADAKSAGFLLGGQPRGPRATAFGWTGADGSTAFADPEVGLAIAVTRNRMAHPRSTWAVCDLIREELGCA